MFESTGPASSGLGSLQNNANCLVLLSRDKDQGLNSRSIFEGVTTLVGASQIAAISRHGGSRKWLIQTGKATNAADFWGRKVRIAGRDYDVLSSEALLEKAAVVTKVIRLHGLPLDFNGNLLQDWVKSYPGLRWIGFSLEHFREEDMRHIHNGVLRIKVAIVDESTALNSIAKIQGKKTVIIGPHKVSFFVNVAGEQVKCYNCQQLGHIRAKCPKNTIKCFKCNRSGHLADECRSNTFAGKLAQSIENAVNEADEVEEEGMDSGDFSAGVNPDKEASVAVQATQVSTATTTEINKAPKEASTTVATTTISTTTIATDTNSAQQLKLQSKKKKVIASSVGMASPALPVGDKIVVGESLAAVLRSRSASRSRSTSFSRTTNSATDPVTTLSSAEISKLIKDRNKSLTRQQLDSLFYTDAPGKRSSSDASLSPVSPESSTKAPHKKPSTGQ